MGLDMYLTKKVYVGADYDHNQVKGVIDLTKQGEKLVIDLCKVQYIELSQSYRRKANAIHKWFVDNCQDGEDDCRPHEVSIEQLQKLVADCETVLASLKNQELVDKEIINWRGEKEIVKAYPITEIAEDLLPTQDGCFFGNTIYNERYKECLERTIEQLKDLSPDHEYWYQASW